MKKATSAGFILAFLLSTVALLQLDGFVIASGNPWPPQPNKTPPTLAVQTPKNNTVFIPNTVSLRFSVTTPRQWSTTGDNDVPLGEVTGIQVWLDANLTAQYGGFGGGQFKEYSLVIDNVTWGKHVLNVTVLSNSYYNPIFPHFHGDVAAYPIVVSEILHINVGTSQASTPSPSPSPPASPTDTPSPSPTPKPTNTPNSTQSSTSPPTGPAENQQQAASSDTSLPTEFGYIIGAAIVISLVVLSSLPYFRRHNLKDVKQPKH